jgi:2-epi-5-epi-valiolone synthase
VRFLSHLPSSLTGEVVGDATVLHLSCVQAISYKIVHPARNVFDLEEGTLVRFVDSRPTFLVLDRTIESLYGELISQYVKAHLQCVGRVAMEGLEANKSWDNVEWLCSEMIRVGLPRDGVIVGIGGGVILDITGLAAALYRRGVRYLRIPTTLVGMVDVCVGAKQAINFRNKKNILGVFYPTLGGINDLSFLRSLPEQELVCGFAEIMKMAIIQDQILFALLEQYGPALVKSHFQSPQEIARWIALRAEQLMLKELESDLFESCRARLVDFGHTFSPALEAASSFRMRHGEAVALDMLLSTIIAVRRHICEESVLTRMLSFYRQMRLPVSQGILSAQKLSEYLTEVRIHRDGRLNMVVPVEMGKATFVEEVSLREIEEAFVLMDRAECEFSSKAEASNSV